MNLKFERPLWAHQEKFLKEFLPKRDFFLSWEMGTGKSTAAIGWLRAKYAAFGDIAPTVIISPLATLWNWKDEFKLNAPQRYQDLIHIAYGKDKLKWPEGTKIVITNYDGIRSLPLRTKLKTFKPVIVVCDEAHKIKNPKSKTFNALLAISDSATYRGCMTGTPILNSYFDLWSQFRFLDKGETFGHSFYVFKEQYFVDKNKGMPGNVYFPDWQPHASTAKELTLKIASKVSRVTKEECLDLPPLVFKREVVELGEEQLKAYKEMEKHLITEVQSGECAASNALVRVLRMLQIVSGHLQVEITREQVSKELEEMGDHRAWVIADNILEKTTHTFKENPRLERLGELLEELTPHHKVIVWCTFRENYKAIKGILNEKKIEFVDLTGDTEDRQGNIHKFQTDSKCRVIVANPSVGGAGVNLTQASYAIYFSRNFSLGDRLQSEARNHRGGSEIHEKITLIDLVAKDTIDEQVLSALIRKENFSDKILDRIKALR